MLPKIPKGIMSEKAERYFGAILEDIQGKLALLIESFAFLDKRTTDLETRVDSTEGRLDDVELKLMDIE
jgi:hypothetical protein